MFAPKFMASLNQLTDQCYYTMPLVDKWPHSIFLTGNILANDTSTFERQLTLRYEVSQTSSSSPEHRLNKQYQNTPSMKLEHYELET